MRRSYFEICVNLDRCQKTAKSLDKNRSNKLDADVRWMLIKLDEFACKQC